MHEILEKKQFSEEVFYLRVKAPEIARNRKAGQFVLVQSDIDYGERIPLTIADANAEEGWITRLPDGRGDDAQARDQKRGRPIEAILSLGK